MIGRMVQDMFVGLNINTKNIKIVAISGRRVKKWAMAELPPGLVRDGLILQPKKVGEIIDAQFKQHGIPRDKVIAGIAGLSFTYRFFHLPHMKAGQLEEAILRAARKEISIPLEELYVSWQRLPDVGNELTYFVIGVERHRVDALVQTMKEAHIEPYLAGLRPLALARLAERSDAIIVGFEESCFDIVFMSGGIPRVIHTITPRETSITLEDNVRRLADELTKTAAFYQSNNPENQLDKSTPLLLTGDWAAEPAASALLQTEVEYPLNELVAQVEIPEDLSMETYASTIGLALKRTPPRTARKEATNFLDININIFAGKYRKPPAKPVPLAGTILWILLALAVIGIYPIYQAWNDAQLKNATLTAQQADLQRQFNIYQLINEDIAVKETAIQELTFAKDNLIAAYNSVLGNRGVYTTELELITSLVPAKTYFSSIEINDNEIWVYGESDNVFTVTGYAGSLKKQGVFQDVRIEKLDEAASLFFTAGTAEAPEPVMTIQFIIVIRTGSAVAPD
jgi:Tfp pilus assembly protein PilN